MSETATATAMTKTEIQLLAIHKAPVVRLVDIAERYMTVGYENLRRKALLNALPFPAFKMEDNNEKASWVVRVEDLAKFLDERGTQGAEQWSGSQA